jgi:glycosyltransferase involved in cell wall biosynthesis
MPRVDLLYLACNRLTFTQETFNTLLLNTDWEQIHSLFVIDDGSIDGTLEWLEANAGRAPTDVRMIRTHFGSPVSAMVHFIESANAPILAKIDNDAMVPPSWLRQSLDVLDRHPELDLLGIEAMYPHINDISLPRDYTPAEFISGLGLYRSSAFSQSRPQAYQKYYGLGEWQMVQGSQLVRGWITPALPVFLLDRTPLHPWTAWADEYVQQGWQRPWPKYAPDCTLWHWHWPNVNINNSTQSLASFPVVSVRSSEDLGCLGALRVKNESAHIHEVIAAALQFCEMVYVFDDHSVDDTVSLCHTFGDRVKVFLSPFQGLDETRDKNYLLRHIISARPEWVLWIDGDEVLERTGPEKLSQLIRANPRVAVFGLQISYLWDDPFSVRVDGIYGHFHRPSLFRLREQNVERLQFKATGRAGNLHCGNIPRGLVGRTLNLDVRLKHYGYMTYEQRMAKYQWYRKVDPHNEMEDEYRHLAGIPGARYAPGPIEVIPWKE